MPVLDRPRCDGQAEWYDERSAPSAESAAKAVRDLLGPGSGWCLDLGCGTGHYLGAIRSTGRQVVGLDLSADQLRIARQVVGLDLSADQLRIAWQRSDTLVQADAVALLFADAAFQTVAALWVSTDVDDLEATMREASRVLRPGGRFLFWGVHPWFNGPGVEYPDDGRRIIHPTYRIAGRHTRSPWWSDNGIRHRVGMRHVPLADLFNAIIGAGLRIQRVVEPGAVEIPHLLAIVADKPGST